MATVLIADKLSPLAKEIFERQGVEADVKVGLSEDELIAIIDRYDGLAVRSATKVTPAVLDAASSLKVIGRAGIGVDNIDIPAATQKGVVVMNTPFGNSITTAEHAIAMMFSLARQIPVANTSTHAGKWEKSRFMGVELTGKTLGIIGCGNIGSIVATRALGLSMKVVAFDPFLTPERAVELGVEKTDLEGLLARADFITLHTPLNDKTRGILDASALQKAKKGVYIINCARGGLVVEADLKTALEDGHVAGAALDVFVEEPARENALFGNERVVATPHLGASTQEAQENVAVQVAEQMADYLNTGAVTNAINMPSVSAAEAPLLKPYLDLAEKLGLFIGQTTETGIKKIEIEYEGTVADLNIKPITAAALSGVLRPLLTDINMVSAPVLAKDRGISVSEVRRGQEGVYETYMRVSVTTERQKRSVAGTLFSDGRPRIIQVNGIALDAPVSGHMLYVTNEDKPGFIGSLGTALGEAGVNIATFNLGRAEPGGDALALIEVDGAPDAKTIRILTELPLVKQAISVSL
ncbi:MAG: phosphoglycerate dehydrogenase [Pseudomonadota bacterium]